MSDPKREKGLRQIASLRRLIEHPSTGDGERAAAQNRLERLCDKWGQTATPPRTPPRPGRNTNSAYRPYEDRTGGFNSTSSSNKTKAEWDFEEWARLNEEMLRKQQAERKAEAERVRKAREEAQERFRRSHPVDHDGLTAAEREEARRDPLGFASRRDGRTAQQRNDDMQNRHAYRPPRPRCAKPESFYDQGGIKRKRNDYPMECDVCGTTLTKGEGAIYQVAGKWRARCVEQVPGPRRKKPGRG